MTLRALRILGKATAAASNALNNGSNVNSRQLETIIEENSSPQSRRVRSSPMANGMQMTTNIITSEQQQHLQATTRFICGFDPVSTSNLTNGGQHDYNIK